MKLRKAMAVVALATIIAACGDDNEPSDTTTATSDTTATADTTAQVANPASEYCEAQGGTVELVDEAGGQVGYCNLPDGTRIEEWEYYNSDNG